MFLFGGVASGKLTTARALSQQIGYPVFHNHLVVDLLTTVFPFGTEPFVRLREDFWLSVVREAALTGRSLIFTFAPEPTVPSGFVDRLRSVLEDAGGSLRSVRLDVSQDVQEARLGDPSRREFHKLTDISVLRSLQDSDADWPSADVVINTDTSSPEESATTIIERFALARQQPLDRKSVV